MQRIAPHTHLQLAAKRATGALELAPARRARAEAQPPGRKGERCIAGAAGLEAEVGRMSAPVRARR